MEIKTKSKYRFIIEILVIGIVLCVGLLWVAPGPLFPLIMQDYGITRATVSWTTSVVPLILAMCAIPAGVIASKIGLKRAFAIGAFLMATGLLTPFCSNIIQLLATRIIFAIGVAMTFPIAGGLVLQWFSGREIPLVNGLNTIAVTGGNAIAMFTAVLMANTLGWKAAPTLYGAIALVLTLAWIILGKERISHATEPAEATLPPISIGAVLKRRAVIWLGLSIGGTFILFMAINSWLPTYYHEIFGMPLAQASAITGLFTAFGMLGCLLGGLLPSWTGLRKPFLIIPGIFIGFAGLGTFLVNNLMIIYTSIALVGICVHMPLPIMFTVAMELPDTNPRIAAVAIAMALAIAYVAGFFGPLIVGFLADVSGSYLPGLVTCSILSWSLLIGGLFLSETGPRAKRPA